MGVPCGLCGAYSARALGSPIIYFLFLVCRSRDFDMKRKEKPVQALTPTEANRLAAPGASPAESGKSTETPLTARR